MKRITFKTFVAVIAVAAVLSSCLGDSHSKADYNNTVSYIVDGKKNDGKNALTNVGGMFNFITSDYLKKLSSKRFYQLNYKVNTQDGTNADGAYFAHSIIAQGLGDPIPETVLGRTPPAYPIQVFPVDASVSFFSAFEKEALDDKFVFNFQCEIDPGDFNPTQEDYSENLHLEATYIEANQTTPVEGGGTERLKPNQIIVNLSLHKDVNYASEGVKKVAHKSLGVIDLQEIRKEFKGRGIRPEEGKTAGEGWIVFQYTKDLGDGKTEVRQIGSFTNNNIAYGMYFIEEK